MISCFCSADARRADKNSGIVDDRFYAGVRNYCRSVKTDEAVIDVVVLFVGREHDVSASVVTEVPKPIPGTLSNYAYC